jgi:RNA-directed DNA polymerase
VKTRRTDAENIFGAENIHNCEKYVFSIQKRLDKAVATNDAKRIRHIFDLLTKRSQAVKTLAAYRITKRNKGKYTAGVDGVAIPKKDTKGSHRLSMKLLNAIDINVKPDTIRRVFIPKPNGKKRPLGIPTLRDRIIQEIIRIALEPIVEYHSHDNSFGFRPKRSCQDAIGQLFNKLSRRTSPRYVIEGDIKGCFDNISHEHITNTLKSWYVPSQTTNLINNILKAEIFHNGEVFDSETGTPQGGVISPLLANVALTAFDNFIENNFSRKTTKGTVNPLVRYADDFIIVCKSKSEAVKIKESIKVFLQERIGLTLSDEKTHITHIYRGFDFLGFTLRKYKKYKNKPCVEPSDYTLLIKPQKEKIHNVRRECRKIISENKSATQEILIFLLNPKIIGWANYYRYVVSSQSFGMIDYEIWHNLLNWGKRRHPQKSKTWIIHKYYTRKRIGRTKRFCNKQKYVYLQDMGQILSKRRFVKVKREMRVYNADHAEYWYKREYLKSYYRLFKKRIRTLFEKQDGLCPYCKTQITETEVVNNKVDIHHMLPRSFNGKDSQSNLRLLHKECHIELHKRLTRKEMAEIVRIQCLDYINAKCY